MNGFAVQVRTRSKVLDYRFVGAARRPERWWEENYGRWTDFSRPTILVEPGKFFVSGIASRRTDSKGARIHYALHVMVEPEGRALAAKVVAWLCNMQRSGSLDTLGECLDGLGEDAWSAAVQGEQTAVDTVNEGVVRMFQEHSPALETAAPLQPFLQCAGDPGAFAQLAAMAATVVALEPGRQARALYLNLASSSELEELRQRGTSAIVCREIDRDPKSARPLLAGAAVVMLGLIVAAAFFL